MSNATTAVVHVSGYAKPDGQMYYSTHWGVDHRNNHYAMLEGMQCTDHVELHAARQAIRIAARQKFSRIIIRCDSPFVYEHIRNSANFAKATIEIRHLVASIQDFKKQIIVNVEHNGRGPDNNNQHAEMSGFD